LRVESFLKENLCDRAVKMSCIVPRGHIEEQYTRPNKKVISRISRATAGMRLKAGKNCIRGKMAEKPDSTEGKKDRNPVKKTIKATH
jgi:hypothetical protein